MKKLSVLIIAMLFNLFFLSCNKKDESNNPISPPPDMNITVSIVDYATVQYSDGSYRLNWVEVLAYSNIDNVTKVELYKGGDKIGTSYSSNSNDIFHVGCIPYGCPVTVYARAYVGEYSVVSSSITIEPPS